MHKKFNIHLFMKGENFYAFNSYNYSIIKLSEVGHEVLMALQNNFSLEEIISILYTKFPKKKILSTYFQLLSLYENDFFSYENHICEHFPNFNRIVLLVSGGCNLGCKYCFEKDVPSFKTPALMSTKTATKVINWFFKNQKGRKAYITLYGGEPLLNWPLIKTIVIQAERLATKKGVIFIPYIITNGTLIDKKKAKWLKNHNVKTQVSIDGDQVTNDRFRVYKNLKPTYKDILKGIKILSENKVDFNLRAVITKKNIHISDILKNLKNYSTDNVSFDFVATTDNAINLNQEDWNSFLIDYRRYLNSSLNSWQLLPDEVQKTINRINKKEIIRFGCGAGISELTIDPDGNIFECERLYRDSIENVFNDPDPQEFKGNFLQNVELKEGCSNCWAKYLCGGGCKHFFITNNTLDIPLSEYCLYKKETIETAIYMIDYLNSKNLTHQLSK